MSLKTQSSDRFRLVCIFLFQTFLFCLIVLKFYQVQIIEGEKWENKALCQHIKYESIPYKRGAFYSNIFLKKGAQKKQSFALDVPKFHLYIDPMKLKDSVKKPMMEKLFSLIETSSEKKEKIQRDFQKKSRYRRIYSFIDRTILDQILDWWKPFYKNEKLESNALFYSQEYQRSHPLGTCLGQVLHTVLKEKDSMSKKALPTGGLELAFKDLLEGKSGKKVFISSPNNRLDDPRVLEEKEDGADIYLTIDHFIQTICEEELEQGVKRANAKGGWAVMMDPNTGDILALAQYPFFDPSNYQKYFNEKELEEHTRCKPIVDTFEPASIMKPIIMAIAMQANEELEKKGEKPLFAPDEKIDTKSGKFPGRTFPLKDGKCHYFMNMDIALQRSANIYMGKIMSRIVEKMGDLWLKEKLEYLGFGEKTGVEFPAEASGLVPTPGKLHPNGTLEWSKPTPYSLAIGHNLLVNSLQMSVCYSMICNGGYKVSPTLIKKIVKNKDDKEVVIPKPEKSLLVKVLTEDMANRLKKSLKFVTKPGGSARLGEVIGYTEAGKTGTSEKIIDGEYSHEKYISSFIGFAPVEDTKFVLMVVMDEPEKKWIPGVGTNHLGGVCSAPVFSKIAERTLHYLGVAPDDPFSYSKKNIKGKKADMTDEIEELKNIYLKWNCNEAKKNS